MVAEAAPEIRYRVAYHSQPQTYQYYEEDLGDGILLKMVSIPEGHFQMGSPPEEKKRRDSEGRQHKVFVPSFYMGAYPITQAQWRQVASGDSAPGHSLDSDPSRFKGDDLPVESVSWRDAMEFCARLSQKTNRSYSLPTEAEWEYACRAGTTTPFHWGETITTDLSNFNGNRTYGNAPEGVYREKTTPVGSLRGGNAFGLYDMHGNVWEWCLDQWHDSYEGKPNAFKEDGSKPWLDEEIDISLSSDVGRSLRGGSWYYAPEYCRSAVRFNNNPDWRNYNLGFRVVCRRRGPRTQ